MKDDLHLHRALKYAADMQRLEKQGHVMCNINEIINKLKARALEHDTNSNQHFKENNSFLAKEEYDKRDGIYEAIDIIKAGVNYE